MARPSSEKKEKKENENKETPGTERLSLWRRIVGWAAGIRIGAKTAVGFALVLVLTAAVGFVGWRGISDYAQQVQRSEGASRLVDAVAKARAEEKDFMLQGGEGHVGRVGEMVDRFRIEALALKENFSREEERAMVDVLVADVDLYAGSFRGYVDAEHEKGKKLEAMITAAMNLVEVAENMRAEQKKLFEDTIAELKKTQADRGKVVSLVSSLERIMAMADRAAAAVDKLKTDGKVETVEDVASTVDVVLGMMKGEKRKIGDGNTKNADTAIGVVEKALGVLKGVIDTAKTSGGAPAAADLPKIEGTVQDIKQNIQAWRKNEMSFFGILGSVLEGAQEKMLTQLAAAEDASRLIVMVGEARLAEQGFLRGQREAADVVRLKIGQIKKLAADIGSRVRSDTSEVMVKTMQQNADDYLQRFDEVVKIIDDQGKARETMVAAAESVTQHVAEF